MGTALKILFSYGKSADDFRLTRGEIVALFNGMNRLSSSIQSLQFFMDENLPPPVVKEKEQVNPIEINSKIPKAKKEKLCREKTKNKSTDGMDKKKKQKETTSTKSVETPKTSETFKNNAGEESLKVDWQKSPKSEPRQWTWLDEKQIFISLIWVILVYVALK